MIQNEDHTAFQGRELLVEAYDERLVKTLDPAKNIFRNPLQKTKNYILSLFPILQWFYRYNLTWLWSDLIAGITVGVVVVPQSMSYAQIAGLPPQYGLYSSLMGFFVFPFFTTSKDVSAGLVAVMSAQTYTVVQRVLEKVPDLTQDDAPGISATLALICGVITSGIGFLRIGFLLEYISMPSILGFMSGSAFTILTGQIPSLMGITGLFNTRDPAYLVIINSLKNLKHSNINAAFGLVCLFLLYFFKYFFQYLAKRDPKHKKWYFYASTMRSGVVIIFSTLISWGVCHNNYDPVAEKYPISILKTVPRGLQDAGVHPVRTDVISSFAPDLPISTIILLLEHIAIAKSFGRINDYKINPNQELIAIGVTNMVGHFFNSAPATGSFSRTALKSMCGVRTPFGGLASGICVLVAVYALTDAFYYISKAALSAIIIHAVTDLISNWQTTWKFWIISPVEFFIFIGDIVLCVFVNIEAGIYFSIAASLVLLLLRVSFPSGQFLGKVEYVRVNNPRIVGAEETPASPNVEKTERYSNNTTVRFDDVELANVPTHESSTGKTPDCTQYGIYEDSGSNASVPMPGQLNAAETPGVKWVPLSHKGINPEVEVLPPPPGVFVFRFSESLLYPNISKQVDDMVSYVREQTKRDIDPTLTVKLGDRPWNDNGPRHRKIDPDYVDPRPFLRAVVLDMSATPHVDFTAVNQMHDAQVELTKYANRPIDFHFVGIVSPWARRALVNIGFGGRGVDEPAVKQVTLARKGGIQEAKDIELGGYVSVIGTNTPYFHFDIPDLS